MSDPYRDQQLSCPACNSPLREFRTRQVCDKCEGMLLALPDLAHAIHDLTSIEPAFEYRDEKPGKRNCPHCAKPMTVCKLSIMFEQDVLEPKPVLDRCDDHGIWFDGEELASIFEKVATKGYGGGVGRKGPKGGGAVRARRALAARGGNGKAASGPRRSDRRERRVRGCVRSVRPRSWSRRSKGRRAPGGEPVIDRCVAHGVWFDPKELEPGGIIGWLRGTFSPSGLDLSARSGGEVHAES